MDDSIVLLHVDDDPDFTDMARAYLKQEDDRLRIRTAISAADGLEFLTEHDVDCIVSDYEMPGDDGIEFLKSVRRLDDELPFILFTGKGSEEIASEAISAGVTDYLQKDTGTEQYQLLANRVDNAVSQIRAKRQAQTTEARYEALFKYTNEAIALVEYEDHEPIIREANDVFETIFVPADEDVTGRNLDDIVTGTDAQRKQAEKIAQDVREGHNTIDVVTRETVDGPRKFHLQAVPIVRGDLTEVRSGFAVYTDITEQVSQDQDTG